MTPPSNTRAALISRKPDSAMLADAAGVPHSTPSATTEKVCTPPLAMPIQVKNSRLRRIGPLSSRSRPTDDLAALGADEGLAAPAGADDDLVFVLLAAVGRAARGRMLPATISSSAAAMASTAATRNARCH